jgi:hypothetical protein
MQAKFYTNPSNSIWDAMKCNICQNILDNICGDHKFRYYIHFNRMLFKIGWFFGYVDIWKGENPLRKNKRRMYFWVHVIDWEERNDCKKRADYRVVIEG